MADARARVRVMLLATTMLWGLNLSVLKWLTGAFDPVLLSAVRMVSAILPMLVLVRYWRSWQSPDRGQWLQMIACGVLMVYLNQWLLAAGLSRSSATNGALITALNPLMSAMLALWLLGEGIHGRRLLGVVLGLAGVAMVILSRPGAQLVQGGVGDALVVLAVLVFTLGAVIIQRLAVRLNAVVIGIGIHVAGSTCLMLHALLQTAWTGEMPVMSDSAAIWGIAVVSGMLSTGIGNLMWNRAIGLVGMARAAVWLYWVPLFGVAAAVGLLGEPLTAWHLAGLLMVFAGTYLGTQQGPAPRAVDQV
ncbi:MAG: DMT family transporter [Burkholderiaceae bacterium]